VQLRRELLFEVMRHRALCGKYFDKAMAGDGDRDAGILYIKASERLATLLGMNAPIGHAVQVIHATALVGQQTSTEEIRGILDNIMHISVRERELLDRRELDGDDSPEVLAEINELRPARGKPSLPESGEP